MLFDYVLPAHLIAQHPVARRDQSRLMVLHRATGEIQHRHFADLPDYLAPGDLLVLNDTRVLPARLIGRREKTGGRWEGLFIRQQPDGLWEMLAHTGGRPEIGETIVIDSGDLKLRLRGRLDQAWLIEPIPNESPNVLLHRFGQMPLPPYIRKGRAEAEDRERYQTIFAHQNGSIAAPTAGLHFTSELFQQLSEKGIHRASVTLHVGLGTFAPIREEDPTQHSMHSEWCEVPLETITQIEACKKRGNRVIGVGTTSTRTLESAAQSGTLVPFQGETDIFIHPPYAFKIIDALVTNFHLPRTTLLLLVGALTGMELLERAYQIAIEQEYRFFSYGDAMLIL